MKGQGHSPVNFIIYKRKLIERVFVIMIVLCALSIPFVGVNYDLTKYLPGSTDSAKALDIMKQEFTYPGMGRVMLQNVSLYEAKAIKDRIDDVEGVDMVLWCDTTANIYGSDSFIDYSKIDDYYEDGNAYMDITFTDSDSSSGTHKAVNEIKQIVGDKGLMAGSAVSDTMLGPTINSEIARVMALAVIFIFLILALTTTSWFEPVLFLTVMFVAIALGMGTNLLFGEISFMSNAVGAVLQLACSMDYSIFLLHAFTREKANGVPPEQAMANALRSSVASIGASGATTIVGFLALALMRFGIGRDMGLVLAKGIAFSLVTVLLLMPALILRFQGLIEKTAHRSFMPSFRKFGEFGYKIRKPVFIVVLLLVIPCYVAQGMSDFTYGNTAISNTPGTEVYENEQVMNKAFGQSNMMLALVPVDDNVTEKKLTEELDGLSYVKTAMGLASVLPEGIPEEIVPHSLANKLHSEHWARVIVNVRSPGESDAAFGYADEIRSMIKKYYPEQTTYLIGVTPSTQDIKQVITKDYSFVNILSLIGVALVVAITYKALVLPLVVLIPIEAAVFINTAIPYIMGTRTMFLGFIIVSCVQLGATIDYSILLTGNYLDARAQGDKKEAAIRAVTQSALSILTSGMILTTVGYGLYFLTSIEAVGGLGELIGRGAFLSMLLVLFMLPICLMIFDRFIVKQDYAEKKHARMNRIHNMKLILPRLSALQQQRQLLKQQMKQNRKARVQELVNRVHRRGKPLDPHENDNPEEEHDDEQDR
ncbi:MAG: RND family transporter [Intestinibacillus sp.]